MIFFQHDQREVVTNEVTENRQRGDRREEPLCVVRIVCELRGVITHQVTQTRCVDH